MALLFSACDDTVTESPDLVKIFSKVGDSETIIGMREFLLTANYPKDAELSFVVTDSPNAPAWSDVASTTSKQVRKFNSSDKQKRELYFSLTTKYSATFTSSQREVDTRYTPTPAGGKYNTPTGFMTPNKTYYAYAYQNGKLLSKSEPITLSDYPDPATLPVQVPEGDKSVWPADPPYALSGTKASVEASDGKKVSLGAYLWGMSAWRTTDGSLHDIEARLGEVAVFPIRLIRPIKSVGFSGGKTYGPCLAGYILPPSLKERLVASSSAAQTFYTMSPNTARGRTNKEGAPWPVDMTATGLGAVVGADLFDFAFYLDYTSAAIAPDSTPAGGILGSSHASSTEAASTTELSLEMSCVDANLSPALTYVNWKIKYVTE